MVDGACVLELTFALIGDGCGGRALEEYVIGEMHRKRKPITKLGRGIYLVLVAFLLVQCKMGHRSASTGGIQTGKTINYYSKKNRTNIQVYEDSVSCLKDSLLYSFQQQFPRVTEKGWKVERVYVRVIPLVKDSTSCEGLYMYRARSGTISARYVNGTPYYFYAVKSNEVLFFVMMILKEIGEC